MPIDDAVKHMKDAIAKTYLAKGEQVISMNQAAVDRGISDLVEVEVLPEWKDLPSDPVVEDTRNIPDFIKNVVEPSNLQIGDSIPSANSFLTLTAPIRWARRSMKNAVSLPRFLNGMSTSAFSVTAAPWSARMLSSVRTS